MGTDHEPATVELPANQDIKQLAHDIDREGNDFAVPLILDFYQFLSALDEQKYLTKGSTPISEDALQSELSPRVWSDLLPKMESAGIVEKCENKRNGFTLPEEE